MLSEVDAEVIDQGKCAQYKPIYDTNVPILKLQKASMHSKSEMVILGHIPSAKSF